MRRPVPRAAIVAGALLVLPTRLGAQGFPHLEHGNLASTCDDCHAGARTEGEPLFSIDPAACRACHDGAAARAVEWDGREATPTNLAFAHPRHPALPCGLCHRAPDAKTPMDVRPAEAETCLSCHAPGAAGHRVRGSPCSACHIPLTQARGLPAERIAAFPKPSEHEDAGWRFDHREEAREGTERCAVCHARESCARCHRNADRLAPIAALGSDARVAELAARRAAQGAPAHGPGFERSHGPAASAGLPRCESCHVETECADCHDAPSRPGFHPPDFVVRHGAEAFAARTECADCHSREVFCRECHARAGVGRAGSASAAFHDAQANWLLAHGEAARRNLETCAACHEQTTCLRCHSARGGWQVNPHGARFDADRLADRSTIGCGLCHIDIPGSR
ncbi:MAG: cytochrome c3 family protein [Gemmatimonadota bacterium]